MFLGVRKPLSQRRSGPSALASLGSTANSVAAMENAITVVFKRDIVNSLQWRRLKRQKIS